MVSYPPAKGWMKKNGWALPKHSANAVKREKFASIRYFAVCSFSILLFSQIILYFLLSKNLNGTTDTVDTYSSSQASILWDKPTKRLLLVVPGHGDPDRLPNLKASLEAMIASGVREHVGLHCIVYVWNKEYLKPSIKALSFCDVKFSSGLWTNHMLHISDTLGKYFVEATHVAIMMDDMDVKSVKISQFLATMDSVGFDVASPAIPGWQTASSLPRENCLAHRTDHVDILFTVFRTQAWQCWHQHIDLDINEKGWGYDLTFADLCNVVIGIVDHEIAFHDPVCLIKEDCITRSYDEIQARSQMDKWIMSSVGAANEKEAEAYFQDVAFIRPLKFAYCEEVELHLASENFYKSTTHRGGWKAVVETLIKNGKLYTGFIESSTNLTRSVELIDCIEEWFLWEKRGVVNKKWVGIAHMIMKEDLPKHVAERELDALDTYISSTDFLASVQNCVSLILFTNEIAKEVDRKLTMLGIYNVHTCVVRHPIAVDTSASLYDPVEDLNVGISDNAPVILLGQQYRRVATIHRLKTQRKKIWLPSRVDEQFIKEKTEIELQAEGVEADENVVVMRVESFSEYDRLVKQSIVVVDLWAAGANNSVMEAIALCTPFFIRRLPGPVEYLGDSYPLFFSTFEELQRLLDDKVMLRQLLLDGYNYLKSMDKSHYSIESFAEQAQTCALQGMEKRKKPVNLPANLQGMRQEVF